MHGVPADLDLSIFHQAALIQVCLGEYQVDFHFHPQACICVEGDWELVDARGERIDHKHENGDQRPYHLHRLLGQSVTASVINPPESFSLYFADGEVLRIFDSSHDCESVSIQPGDIFI